jgi:ubiquinone biosynthesis protein Coq4
MQSTFNKMKMKNKIIVNANKNHSVRERLVLWILEKGAPIHYHFCSKRKAWNLDSNDLISFPEGSLGNELGKFYKKQHFEPIPKAERHDVFHVLLGYSTNVIDEAAMQFFLWGNGKASLYTIGTAIISAVLFPVKKEMYKEAFLKGKRSTNISNWNFKELLQEDCDKLKRLIFKTN